VVLSDIELKAVYDSDEDDIVSDFFIPVLSSAKSYLGRIFFNLKLIYPKL